MKFKFTIQEYQTSAVQSVVDVFKGQPFTGAVPFTQTIGSLDMPDVGVKNAPLMVHPEQLLANIKSVQSRNDLTNSTKISKIEGLGACILDVDMETGTGKTYVYIKTMFELHKNYGWTKFIVIVPTVAIREGVFKNFAALQDHFMEYYGEKARYFIYNPNFSAGIRH